MHNQFKTQKSKHLMLAMGPRDLNSAPYSPLHCSSHSMTSFQPSELTELPVVENSQLFAQRVHSARYAPIVDIAPLVSHVLTPSECLFPQGFPKGLRSSFPPSMTQNSTNPQWPLRMIGSHTPRGLVPKVNAAHPPAVSSTGCVCSAKPHSRGTWTPPGCTTTSVPSLSSNNEVNGGP